MLSWATPVAAQRGHYQWCFSPAYPFTAFNPTIDGILNPESIAGDIAWTNSFKYVFNNGTSSPDVVVMAMSRNGKLYVGAQVKNDPSFDREDTIIMGFGWDTADDDDLPDTFARVHVNPLIEGGEEPAEDCTCECPLTEACERPEKCPQSTYWPGTGTTSRVEWGVKEGNPCWLTQATVIGPAASPTSWDTEIEMELGAGRLPVPSGQPLYFYFNLFRAQRPPGVDCSIPNPPEECLVHEFPWPSEKSARVDGSDESQLIFGVVTGTPAPAHWGRGAIGSKATCKGVNFDISDISSDPAYLRAGTPASLRVNLHNNGVNGASGAAVPATNVVATFLRAPYGMSGFSVWDALGQATVPLIAYDGPALGGVPGTPASISWTPDVEGHHCIRVQLTSNDEATTFVNQGSYRNMIVAEGSTVTLRPMLNAKGLPAPADGGAIQKVRVSARSELEYAYADGQLTNIAPGRLVGQLSTTYVGSVRTSRHVDVGNQRFYIAEQLASYGHTIQHPVLESVAKAYFSKNQATIDKLYQTQRARKLKLWGQAAPHPGHMTHRPQATSVDGMVLPEKLPTPTELAKVPLPYRTAVVRQLNDILANVPEKPPATHWATKLPAAYRSTEPHAKQSSGLIQGNFILEVPVNGRIDLPTTIVAEDKPIATDAPGTGGTGNGTTVPDGKPGSGDCSGACCRCGGEPATGGATTALTMILGAVGGVFILSRGAARRRRRERDCESNRRES